MTHAEFIPSSTELAPTEDLYRFGGIGFRFNGGMFGLATFKRDQPDFNQVLNGIPQHPSQKPENALLIFDQRDKPRLVAISGFTMGRTSIRFAGHVIGHKPVKEAYLHIHRFDKSLENEVYVRGLEGDNYPFEDRHEGYDVGHRLSYGLNSDRGVVNISQRGESLHIQARDFAVAGNVTRSN